MIKINPSPFAIGSLIVLLLTAMPKCLLKTHITALTMDITYLLDPSLDSNIKLDENNLDKPGYTLVLSDYPSNNKHGSVYK